MIDYLYDLIVVYREGLDPPLEIQENKGANLLKGGCTLWVNTLDFSYCHLISPIVSI